MSCGDEHTAIVNGNISIIYNMWWNDWLIDLSVFQLYCGDMMKWEKQLIYNLLTLLSKYIFSAMVLPFVYGNSELKTRFGNKNQNVDLFWKDKVKDINNKFGMGYN